MLVKFRLKRLKFGTIGFSVVIETGPKNRYLQTDTIKTEFNRFYDIICKRKLSMSAIVNFLFTYKDRYMENISELIDTNTFIISSFIFFISITIF